MSSLKVMKQRDASCECERARNTASSTAGYSTKIATAVCVQARKGLALPRASHSGEIALRRLRSKLAAAPVLFAHAVVTEI